MTTMRLGCRRTKRNEILAVSTEAHGPAQLQSIFGRQGKKKQSPPLGLDGEELARAASLSSLLCVAGRVESEIMATILLHTAAVCMLTLRNELALRGGGGKEREEGGGGGGGGRKRKCCRQGSDGLAFLVVDAELNHSVDFFFSPALVPMPTG